MKGKINECDMVDYSHRLFLDVISDIAFGLSFDTINGGKDDEARAIYEGMDSNKRRLG